jgi:hypothetical protein
LKDTIPLKYIILSSTVTVALGEYCMMHFDVFGAFSLSVRTGMLY